MGEYAKIAILAPQDFNYWSISKTRFGIRTPKFTHVGGMNGSFTTMYVSYVTYVGYVGYVAREPQYLNWLDKVGCLKRTWRILEEFFRIVPTCNMSKQPESLQPTLKLKTY